MFDSSVYNAFHGQRAGLDGRCPVEETPEPGPAVTASSQGCHNRVTQPGGLPGAESWAECTPPRMGTRAQGDLSCMAPGAAVGPPDRLGPGESRELTMSPRRFSSCPPWALVGATPGPRSSPCMLRTEAWRTVLEAGGPRRLDSLRPSFGDLRLVPGGAAQGHWRFACRESPCCGASAVEGAPAGPAEVALADAPILVLELCTSAVLAALAATAIPATRAMGAAPLFMMGGVAFLLAGSAARPPALPRPSASRPGLAVWPTPAGAQPAGRDRVRLHPGRAAAHRDRPHRLRLPAGPAHAALLLFSMGAIGPAAARGDRLRAGGGDRGCGRPPT